MTAAWRSRVGIMQGRLVPSSPGELLCSPGDRWRDEFEFAASIGLHHIELVADAVCEATNPIWTEQGRAEIDAIAKATTVGVPSLCVNEPVASPFDEDRAVDLAQRLRPVVDHLGTRLVVLPLLEASDLMLRPWAGVARAVAVLAKGLRTSGAVVALEVAVPAPDAVRFLDEVRGGNVGLCYDLGNATAFGYDAPHELRFLGSRVHHVHAKDKDATGTNVVFGSGDVRFGEAFGVLGAGGYTGLVTIEATRGDVPVATAAEHLRFLAALDETSSEVT